MLDIKFIRENPNEIKKSLLTKGVEPTLVDSVIENDKKLRQLTQKRDELRARLNEISRDPQWGKDNRLIQPAGEIKKELDPIEAEVKAAEEEYKNSMYALPNIPLSQVPIGDEKDFKIIKEVGQKPKFDFVAKDHVELGKKLNLLDIERAAKVSGSRFSYLKNELVFLELALVNYALEKLTKHNFQAILPPALIKFEITKELGYWTQGNHANYYFVKDSEELENGREKDNPLYLIGTGEHSTIPMYMDETLNEKELPLKLAAFSPCFRREAGTYGKDTKGILRVHQFDKIEMIAYVKAEDDEKERKEMLSIAENLVESLGLPFRVIRLASNDISFPSAETIDIETWIPSQNKYRETHSISTTTDFQARRLNIKYKKGDKNEFVHILNGTAFAIGRTLIAIMENYQQKDGSILIPKVLQKYTGFESIPKKI